MKRYYVYIISSPSLILYVGVTNNLQRRVWEHRQKLIPSFTSRYNVCRLLYYDETSDVLAAIAREKQIKNWRRKKKFYLIELLNPQLRDLSAGWFE